MNLSQDRINFLAHQIVKTLKGAMTVPAEESKLLSAIKFAFGDFGKFLEEMDAHVRKKIASMKRGIPEGSREWDILYRQYSEEETEKRGL